MSSFLKAAPKIELSLSNASSVEVVDAVVARQVDFGLVVNPRPHPDLVQVDLFKDAVEIVVAASSIPAAARSISPRPTSACARGR
jgi:DNA-binding transcriptional LysR family regulator